MGYIFVALLGIAFSLVFILFVLIHRQIIKANLNKEKKRIQVIERAAQHIIEWNYLSSTGKLEEYPLIRKYLAQSEILLKYYVFFSEKQRKEISITPIYREATSEFNSEKFIEEVLSSSGTIRNLTEEVSESISLLYNIEHPLKYCIHEIKKNLFLRIIKLIVKACLLIIRLLNLTYNLDEIINFNRKANIKRDILDLQT